MAERDTSATDPDGTLLWLQVDQNNTPVMEIDSDTGAVTRRYSDPYGNSRGSTVSWSSAHGYLNAPTSALSSLTLLGAREYDPTLGKFLSVDSVLAPNNPQQNNGYSYAQNNPVTMSDPTGLCALTDSGSGCSKGATSAPVAPAAAPGNAPGQSPFQKFLYKSANNLLGQFSQDPNAFQDGLWNAAGFTHGADGNLRTEQYPLQLLGGYNKKYDDAFKAATEMGAQMYPFVYGGTSYVIWTWKGEYLNTGDGGEIGMYEQFGSHPDINGQWWANPLDPNLPKMSESVSVGGTPVASYTPAQSQVWVGSWDPHVQDRNVSDLTFSATVTFPSAGMHDAFRSSVSGNKHWSNSSPNNTTTMNYK